MNEKMAWVADGIWGTKWYLVIAFVAFGLGWTGHKAPLCPECNCDISLGALEKTFIKVNPDDVVNMSQTPGLCDVDGLPVIRMFSTSWCPHCQWAGPIFDEFAAENAGKAVFEHLDVETGDNSLTPEVEKAMTMQDYVLYDQFSGKSIPMYTFGCQYYRVGNAFEKQQDTVLEKQAYQKALDLVITSAPPVIDEDEPYNPDEIEMVYVPVNVT